MSESPDDEAQWCEDPEKHNGEDDMGNSPADREDKDHPDDKDRLQYLRPEQTGDTGRK